MSISVGTRSTSNNLRNIARRTNMYLKQKQRHNHHDPYTGSVSMHRRDGKLKARCDEPQTNITPRTKE
jgi:hypothetical protein